MAPIAMAIRNRYSATGICFGLHSYGLYGYGLCRPIYVVMAIRNRYLAMDIGHAYACIDMCMEVLVGMCIDLCIDM